MILFQTDFGCLSSRALHPQRTRTLKPPTTMAAKQLLSNPNSIQIPTPSLLPLPSIHNPQSSFVNFKAGRRFPWRYGQGRTKLKLCRCLLQETLVELSSSSAMLMVGDVGSSTAGYSPASYYTSLGLFVISVPGLWSLIKRSVKSKIVQKSFVGEEKKAPNQIAGEILSFFTRNNFAVSDRGETITFEGIMAPSRGQAALLTFCTCISLASVALVLTITFPDFGNNWFWITVFSPLAGAYYWKRAARKEQIKVKMMVGEDGVLSEIVVQGDDQQVEQMRKELQLSEKGMVYVKGIFER